LSLTAVTGVLHPGDDVVCVCAGRW